MDAPTFFFWFLVVCLILVGWLWRHKRGEWGFRSIPQVLRRYLKAAGSDELQVVRVEAKEAREQLATRLHALEAQVQVLRQSGAAPREREPRSSPRQDTGPFHVSKDASESACYRSITRFGLRFTLSDSLWGHAGKTSSDLLTDQEVSAMIQGPFCPKCLKRWVKRVTGGRISDLSERCRFCGVPWAKPDFEHGHIHVINLKRWVYDHVDHEIRTHSAGSPLIF
jgi:hypothetical protein